SVKLCGSLYNMIIRLTQFERIAWVQRVFALKRKHMSIQNGQHVRLNLPTAVPNFYLCFSLHTRLVESFHQPFSQGVHLSARIESKLCHLQGISQHVTVCDY